MNHKGLEQSRALELPRGLYMADNPGHSIPSVLRDVDMAALAEELGERLLYIGERPMVSSTGAFYCQTISRIGEPIDSFDGYQFYTGAAYPVFWYEPPVRSQRPSRARAARVELIRALNSLPEPPTPNPESQY